MPIKKYRWTSISATYVWRNEAELCLKEVQRRWPEDRFRVYGHSLSGFRVQVREEIV